MSTSSWDREVRAAARGRRVAGRIGVAAALLCAALSLDPVVGSAADGSAQQAAGARKESPYARYAREHAKTGEKKPARVKTARSGGRGRPGDGAHGGRQ